MWKYFVICSYLNSRVENWPLHSKILQWKQRYKKATKDLDWVVHSTLRYTTLLWKNLRISVLDFSFKSDWFDSETLPEISTFTFKRQRQPAINSSFYFFHNTVEVLQFLITSTTIFNYNYNPELHNYVYENYLQLAIAILFKFSLKGLKFKEAVRRMVLNTYKFLFQNSDDIYVLF